MEQFYFGCAIKTKVSDLLFICCLGFWRTAGDFLATYVFFFCFPLLTENGLTTAALIHMQPTETQKQRRLSPLCKGNTILALKAMQKI